MKTEASKVLQEAWGELTERVLEEFKLNGYDPNKVQLQPGYRMQYRGQLNDLEIESPIRSASDGEDWDKLVDAYNNTYGRVYSDSARSPELGYSVTGAIMRGTVPIQKPIIPKEELQSGTPPEEAKLGTRKFYRKKRWVDAQLYHMESLRPGNRVKGPAIIESDATTFVVPDGFETWFDAHRLFHLKGSLSFRRFRRTANPHDRIRNLEKAIKSEARQSDNTLRLMSMPGMGPITAMAIEAFAPTMTAFRKGRDFAAWLGLVPRQHSSGGKQVLGRTSKIGQRDIRRLLIIGAMTVIRWACRKAPPENSWLGKMLSRKPRMLVAIALANKMARSVGAMMTKNEEFKVSALVTA